MCAIAGGCSLGPRIKARACSTEDTATAPTDMMWSPTRTSPVAAAGPNGLMEVITTAPSCHVTTAPMPHDPLIVTCSKSWGRDWMSSACVAVQRSADEEWNLNVEPNMAKKTDRAEAPRMPPSQPGRRTTTERAGRASIPLPLPLQQQPQPKPDEATTSQL